VVLVTSGPGATNAITGIVDALMDSIPLVVITGQVPTHLIGSDAFQEADTIGITRVLHQAQLPGEGPRRPATGDPRGVPYRHRPGRPGPVLIDIPKDVQFGRAAYQGPGEVKFGHTYAPRTKGDPSRIAEAVRLIANARKPLFYTGGGRHQRRSEGCRDPARPGPRHRAPITSTLMGLGAFPASDPQWLGMVGMHGSYESEPRHARLRCDGLCRRALRRPRHRRLDAFAPNSKKIHIDIDPSSINKNVRVDVGIIGDAGEVLADMLAAWNGGKAKALKIDAWWKQIDAWRARKGFGLPALGHGDQAAARHRAALRPDPGQGRLHHHRSGPAPDVGGRSSSTSRSPTAG
jgi:acetolactate synthase-1/2/3 large subunit